MKFRKKPVVIEAVQWTGDNPNEVLELADFKIAIGLFETRRVVEIETLEGTMRGEIGDWIIKGVKGEFYPCKPDIFEATYDRVGEP